MYSLKKSDFFENLKNFLGYVANILQKVLCEPLTFKVKKII